VGKVKPDLIRYDQRSKRANPHADQPAPLLRRWMLPLITTSCYQRRPLLGTPWSRDLFIEVMEQIRWRHQFVVVGYVVMPEHVHLLFTEPERGNLSLVLAALKQTFAHVKYCARAPYAALTEPLPAAVGHV
jgi:Transposase IS200 like